jgi:endonuclease/exonuclease/phosphatase family metal-dependent hydrolase
MHNSDRRNKPLKIWQQNVNKSRICQHDLVSSARLVREEIDIIALQEPSINHLGNTITSQDWTTIYPTNHAAKPQDTRSIMLIRANILTDNWKQFDMDTGDITAIKIDGVWGTLTIFNAYIDCDHDRSINALETASRLPEETTQSRSQEQKHMLWLGDFNRHHPMWDAPSDIRLFTQEALDKAEKLIKVVADAGLELALPPHMPTHRHNVTKRWTRLDQVFLSDHSMDALVTCEAKLNENLIRTDHVPIITELDLSVTRAPTRHCANFKEVDWDKFRADLRARLPLLGPAIPITSQQALTEECGKLTLTIQKTIDTEVPEVEICPHSKRWWTKELTQLRRKTHKLGRKASKHKERPDDPIHD